MSSFSSSILPRVINSNSGLPRRLFFTLMPLGLFLAIFMFQLNHPKEIVISSIETESAFTSTTDEVTIASDNQTSRTPVFYAIYDTHTPNIDGLRAFDYAFYLPLTALAWERVGFVSFIVIIGSQCEWENDPVLQVILKHLKERRAVVSFLPAPLDNRMLLSQTARIFGANMDDFPGHPDDYLITSDSDLWPLAREFFIPPPDKDLVLVHGLCCGDFLYKGTRYRMYPMGNIGATVSTWREIMNDGHSVAKDADGILNYYEDEYGAFVRRPVQYASPEWFYDQKLVSIRIAQWIEKHGNSTVEWVTNRDFNRVDRANWKAENLTVAQFEKMYDAHLLDKIYRPETWKRVLPLLQLMYGVGSSEKVWATKYAEEFYDKVKKYASLV